jgi:dTMP kinase
MSRGCFITLEGVDGCGKSSLAARLGAWLKSRRQQVVLTFEPGGWSQGQLLRRFILDIPFRSPRSEFFLFLADREEHVTEVVSPALREGKWVLCERYSDSTQVYQLMSRVVRLERAKKPDPEKTAMERWLRECRFPVPDLTFYLRVSLEKLMERLAQRGTRDRFESKGREFMEDLILGYEALAEAESRILPLNASLSEEEVFQEAKEIILRRCTPYFEGL